MGAWSRHSFGLEPAPRVSALCAALRETVESGKSILGWLPTSLSSLWRCNRNRHRNRSSRCYSRVRRPNLLLFLGSPPPGHCALNAPPPHVPWHAREFAWPAGHSRRNTDQFQMGAVRRRRRVRLARARPLMLQSGVHRPRRDRMTTALTQICDDCYNALGAQAAAEMRGFSLHGKPGN